MLINGIFIMVRYIAHASSLEYNPILVEFLGRNQILVGVVPKETPFLSNQSRKSVCPLAIANCKEDRSVFFF